MNLTTTTINTMPFTATTESGIVLTNLSYYPELSQNGCNLLAYLDNMILENRLEGLEVELFCKNSTFYIRNLNDPNYTFTVHATQDLERFIVVSMSGHLDPKPMSSTSLIEYIESFFYVETGADAY